MLTQIFFMDIIISAQLKKHTQKINRVCLNNNNFVKIFEH